MKRQKKLINKAHYVSGPFIRENTVEYRKYQEKIVREVDSHNALIILPTGLGKTLIAIFIMTRDLSIKGGKALMIAPSRPLVNQHKKTFEAVTTLSPIIEVTGKTPLTKRKELWKKGKVIVATPQTVEHDLISGNFDPREITVVCFDEAHHSVGEHSYAFVARELKRRNPSIHIIGITASPGHDEEKVLEIVSNLGVDRIIAKTENDPDVRPYVMGYSVEWRRVSLWPEMKKVLELLKTVESRLKSYLRQVGIKGLRTKKDVLQAFDKIREMEKEQQLDMETVATAMKTVAQLVLVLHSIELLETQGVSQLLAFITTKKKEVKSGKAAKSTREFLMHPEIREAEYLLIKLRKEGKEHPKIDVLKKIISTINSRIIIFTQYRATAMLLNSYLPGSRVLLGHSSRNGVKMSQKEQIEVVNAFKEGKFRILITTSVGEEGLDIAECDHVIFYEPIPSAIRTIQRRGRTGRHSPGKVIILMAIGTRDEAYYWSARYKEKTMKEIIKKAGELVVRPKQISLDMFSGVNINTSSENIAKEKSSPEEYLKEPGSSEESIEISESPESPEETIDGLSPPVLIYVDSRERSSPVVRRLHEMGDKIIVTTLDVGDFVVAHDIAVEYKTMEDLGNSIIDARVFEEAKKLRATYEHPIFVVSKGKALRGISLGGLMGSIASLITDYGIPVYIAADEREAARFIHALALHRQREKKGSFSPRKFKPDDPNAQLVYLVAGIPGIGSSIARKLLEKFGTVQKIANAGIKELMEVEGIGPNLARKIYNIMRRKYNPVWENE